MRKGHETRPPSEPSASASAERWALLPASAASWPWSSFYVVLAVGPIFFALAKIDRTLLEAARDVGATPFQIFREITLPLSLPGVGIGMIFFVMLMGEFATAVVVYGGKTSTTGTIILNYYGIANYPFAAVNAIMLTLVMMCRCSAAAGGGARCTRAASFESASCHG